MTGTVLIGGELPYGKPDHRMFRTALRAIDSVSSQAWMVGALGMHAIWVDAQGRGMPTPTSCQPDRVVKPLAELNAPAGVGVENI